MDKLPICRVAVLVGTALDPSKSKRLPNFPGITINTLWGEMAAQLAMDAGNPKLYDLVKEADKKGVSPGSETIKNLFDACGPCVVLVDELVAYAKKLWKVDGLPAGSFDNMISFIQEITEAARASQNSLVVASIPESNVEIGGEAGQQALEAIEHDSNPAIAPGLFVLRYFPDLFRRLAVREQDCHHDLSAHSKAYDEILHHGHIRQLRASQRIISQQDMILLGKLFV